MRSRRFLVIIALLVLSTLLTMMLFVGTQAQQLDPTTEAQTLNAVIQEMFASTATAEAQLPSSGVTPEPSQARGYDPVQALFDMTATAMAVIEFTPPNGQPVPGLLPNPPFYAYALLSNIAYTPNTTSLPSGWEELMRSPEDQSSADSDATGYFGIAYINHERREVVIAHRGTEPLAFNFDNMIWNAMTLNLPGLIQNAVPLDITADIQLIFGWIPAQVEPALGFIRAVQTRLREEGHSDFELTQTGHSLGGALAEISVQQYNVPGRAFTFDSPGTLDASQTLPVDARIFSYVAAPNAINTARRHAGRVILIEDWLTPRTQFPVEPFPGQLEHNYLEYTLHTHDLLRLIGAAFETDSGEFRFRFAVDVTTCWPVGIVAGRTNYSEFNSDTNLLNRCICAGLSRQQAICENLTCDELLAPPVVTPATTPEVGELIPRISLSYCPAQIGLPVEARDALQRHIQNYLDLNPFIPWGLADGAGSFEITSAELATSNEPAPASLAQWLIGLPNAVDELWCVTMEPGLTMNGLDFPGTFNNFFVYREELLWNVVTTPFPDLWEAVNWELGMEVWEDYDPNDPWSINWGTPEPPTTWHSLSRSDFLRVGCTNWATQGNILDE